MGVPTAELSFGYGEHSIDCFDVEDKIYELIHNQWYYFKRNHALEHHYMQQLDALPLYFYQYLLEYSSLQANRFTYSPKTWQKHIHLLLDSGWRIVLDLGFPVALPDFDYIPQKTLTPDGLHHLVLTQKSRAEV